MRKIYAMVIGVAVVTAAAGLPPPGVPTAPAKHALHICTCSQTSVESTNTSNLTLQSFNIRKYIWKDFITLNN
jgi:hypothetical protein